MEYQGKETMDYEETKDYEETGWLDISPQLPPWNPDEPSDEEEPIPIGQDSVSSEEYLFTRTRKDKPQNRKGFDVYSDGLMLRGIDFEKDGENGLRDLFWNTWEDLVPSTTSKGGYYIPEEAILDVTEEGEFIFAKEFLTREFRDLLLEGGEVCSYVAGDFTMQFEFVTNTRLAQLRSEEVLERESSDEVELCSNTNSPALIPRPFHHNCLQEELEGFESESDDEFPPTQRVATGDFEEEFPETQRVSTGEFNLSSSQETPQRTADPELPRKSIKTRFGGFVAWTMVTRKRAADQKKAKRAREQAKTRGMRVTATCGGMARKI